MQKPAVTNGIERGKGEDMKCLFPRVYGHDSARSGFSRDLLDSSLFRIDIFTSLFLYSNDAAISLIIVPPAASFKSQKYHWHLNGNKMLRKYYT